MGEENKYNPGLMAMDIDVLEGEAKAAQSQTNRSFEAFEADIEIIINMGMFEEDNAKQVKELKNNTGDTLTRYEEILSRLEASYSMKPEKFKTQIKDMNDNFGVINTRRYQIRKLSLEASKAIEEERNKKEEKSRETSRGATGSRGGEGDKMFKVPTGPTPDRISLEYTPLQAMNWRADMNLFLKTCNNLQVLSNEEQTTLIKRYVSTAMWPLVEVERGDDIGAMVKKVTDAYDRQVPKFARKVKFLELTVKKGESYISWANRINEQAELADLRNIKAQDLQLMSFCKGLNKGDRLYDKIVDMETPNWVGAQEIIKKHSQSMALKADLVDSAPKSNSQVLNQLSGGGVSNPRPPSKSPEGQRDRGASRGRKETKTPHKGKEGGRSKSGARECWGCNEVVAGDHYAYNCPKVKKNDEGNRPITPYPRKDRSSSGDKNNASQGNETFRRFIGSFGEGPRRVLIEDPALGNMPRMSDDMMENEPLRM